MADYPSFPVWTGELIADTVHMTNEEFGAYMRLLVFAWRTPDCALPHADDDRRVATMLGVTRGKWLKVKPVVLAPWTIENGKGYQKKLTKVRAIVAKKVEQKRLAGIASAKARALKRNEQGPTDVATALPSRYQQPKPNTTLTTSVVNGADAPDFAKAIFSNGVGFLQTHGTSERQARSVIGKWRKTKPDKEIFDAFAAASKANIIDPIPWITAKLEGKGNGKPSSEDTIGAFLAGATGAD